MTTTYVMPQSQTVVTHQPAPATVVTQPTVAGSSVIVLPPAESKRDGPNMGNKQNVYVWISDECGCCNDCCICECSVKSTV